MKKTLKTTISSLTIFLATFATATPAFAQPKEWEGINQKCVGGTNGDVATIQGLECLIANILSVFLTLIGLAGFIMLIYGAFTWMTSGGNSQATQKAGKTMLFAVVGLIVALSAFMILNLVAEFTGIDTILNFFIPGSDTQW
jgi:type IV secretion system pilin